MHLHKIQISALLTGVVVLLLCLVPLQVVSKTATDDPQVEQAYKAYVRAWRVKDIATLQRLISEDYMAVNFENKLSDKHNEIETAKTDADWISMEVDEIHSRRFGNSAIASGVISAAGKRPDGSVFNARVRFLAALVKDKEGSWQLVATQSAAMRSPKT
jgi:ketosteroid isomerase-like protein